MAYLRVAADGGQALEVEVGSQAAELEQLGEGGAHVTAQRVLLVAEGEGEREVAGVARALGKRERRRKGGKGRC